MKIIYIIGLLIMMSAFVAASEKPKVVILLGSPGCGKGTQAKMLSESLGIPHISTGDIFRALLKEDSDLSKRTKAYINVGKLVPDELTNEILFDRIAKSDAARGYILDGYPRTLFQAEAFDRHIEGKANVVVINFQVSDDTVIKRISGRLSCPQCGSVFNKYFSPPKEEGKCDQCHASFASRPDDAPEVVTERLKVYNTQTKPLIDYYTKKGTLVNIDGEKGTEEVYTQIKSKF